MRDSKQAVGSRGRSVPRKPASNHATGPLADVLGASTSFAVTQRHDGPFGAAALLEEVKGRLVSRGGRPSDPDATIRRLVPLKRQVWRALQAQARILSRRRGRPIRPTKPERFSAPRSPEQVTSTGMVLTTCSSLP